MNCVQQGVCTHGVCGMIGNTPLLQLCTTGTGSRLLLKMDSFNPTGSVKVRMALEMVLGAERSGSCNRVGALSNQQAATPV